MCSPRSMYSLAATVRISCKVLFIVLTGRKARNQNIMEERTEGHPIQTHISNIMQELFTSFAARWAPNHDFRWILSDLDLSQS
jgi:hypothetical protein